MLTLAITTLVIIGCGVLYYIYIARTGPEERRRVDTTLSIIGIFVVLWSVFYYFFVMGGTAPRLWD